MRKLAATVLVLGQLLGYSILKADDSQHNIPVNAVKEEARIDYASNESMLNIILERLHEELRRGMLNLPANKKNSLNKTDNPWRNNSRLDNVNLNFNHELKSEEKTKAKINANLVVNENRKIKSIGFTGESGLARIVMSYDAQNNHSTTQISVGKETRVDITLRDYKNPLIKGQVRVLKGMNITSVYDPQKNYLSARVGANYKGASINLNKEWIINTERTTTSINYALPQKYKLPITSLGWTHISSNNAKLNKVQANSKLGPVNIVVSADNLANPKEYKPSISINYSKSF